MADTSYSATRLILRLQIDTLNNYQECHASGEDEHPVSCPLPSGPDLSKLTVVELAPAERLPDYMARMSLANTEGGKVAW